MEMVRIAKISDFRDRKVRSYKILARPVGVFREANGNFRAMEVGCKHENADLTEGRMQGDVVTCPWHGWKYNLRTGECLWGSTVCLRPYDLEVRGEDIYISMHPVEDKPDTEEEDWSQWEVKPRGG